MSKRLVIPKGAVEERRLQGVAVPESRFAGCNALVILYQGRASDGYKSDYEHRPARWLLVCVTDTAGKRVERQAWRFGGKNYAAGLKAFEQYRPWIQ